MFSLNFMINCPIIHKAKNPTGQGCFFPLIFSCAPNAPYLDVHGRANHWGFSLFQIEERVEAFWFHFVLRKHPIFFSAELIIMDVPKDQIAMLLENGLYNSAQMLVISPFQYLQFDSTKAACVSCFWCNFDPFLHLTRVRF